MECQPRGSAEGGDRLELSDGDRPFDASASTWLIGQAIRYLHADDEEAKLSFSRVTELLRNTKEAAEVIQQLYQRAAIADVPMRWSLLYLVGEIGDRSAAEFLMHVALQRLPEDDGRQGCEGPRDMELLVRTMAIEALQTIAGRDREVAAHFRRIIAARPAQPVLIEAVKAARELGLQDELRELLPREDHWILDIRRSRAEEISAEAERKDSNEKSLTPPLKPAEFTAPTAHCCTRKEN